MSFSPLECLLPQGVSYSIPYGGGGQVFIEVPGQENGAV